MIINVNCKSDQIVVVVSVGLDTLSILSYLFSD